MGAIIMDEIDGLNSGDKGGITSLISVIRQKKTKKQISEPISNNPIFCLSTNEIDKKTKELIKVCNHYYLLKPTDNEINNMLESNIFTKKSIIEISKDIVKTLYKKHINIDKHNIYINENDRTIVALLWHENICDIFDSKSKDKNVLFYQKILDNFCYGDYIDRITFQKQIWQFNELSSFIKIMNNNSLIHNKYKISSLKKNSEIRFTK